MQIKKLPRGNLFFEILFFHVGRGVFTVIFENCSLFLNLVESVKLELQFWHKWEVSENLEQDESLEGPLKLVEEKGEAERNIQSGVVAI